MRGMRGPNGVHFGVFDTIPIRARAYNDCVKDAVLLKTASKHVQAEVSWTPKWVHFGALKDSTSDPAFLLSERIPVSVTCVDVYNYMTPKMGPFWGCFRMTHLSWFRSRFELISDYLRGEMCWFGVEMTRIQGTWI